VTVGDGWGGTAETADEPRPPFVDEVIAPDTRDARSREDTTSTSEEPDMSDCGSADESAPSTADTDSSRKPGFVGQFLARSHPPDIWEKDRPALAKLQAYAQHGAGAPAEGPLRDVQVWWFRLVTRPNTAWAYWKAWALERPFRGCLFLLAQLAWWALNIITLVHLL
jgi:hypothetical protein